MTKIVSQISDTETRYSILNRTGTNWSPKGDVIGTNLFKYERAFNKKARIYGLAVNGFEARAPSYVTDVPHPATDEFYRGGKWSSNPPIHPDLPFQLRVKLTDTDFSGLTTAMEGKSTVLGIADRASRLAKAYRSLRHGDLGGFGKALDVSIPASKRRRAGTIRANASGHLLEYQFGLVPLYQDMFNFAKTLYDLSHEDPIWTVKTTIKEEREYSMDQGFAHRFRSLPNGSFTIAANGSFQRDIKELLLYKGYAKVTVNRVRLRPVDAFGFSNPISSLWAVAPQSWIVDAFLPVGSFLQQLYLPPSIRILDSGQVLISSKSYTDRKGYGTRMSHFQAKGCMAIREPGAGRRFRLYISGMNISDVQFPKTVGSLPFLGQAITMLAFADLQSKKLTNLIKKQRS